MVITGRWVLGTVLGETRGSGCGSVRGSVHVSNVSDTTQKTPTHQNPNCIRNTSNAFYRMRVAVPLPEFCEKLLPTQNFTKVGQLAADL